MTEGQRNAQYVEGHDTSDTQIPDPLFRRKGLSKVTSGLIQEYRIKRMEDSESRRGKPLARNTMHQEMVALRQVLKLALRHGYLSALRICRSPTEQ